MAAPLPYSESPQEEVLVLRSTNVSPWCSSLGKRIFDVVVSTSCLLLVAPAFPLIVIAIKLTSKGPLFYVHTRSGQHGRAFKMYKFRTMAHQVSRRGSLLTRAGDSRVTRIGRVLRKWKLDELPQLLNVLRGDMSIVGPRPHIPRLLTPLAKTTGFLALRPGVTGFATLHFRNEEGLLPTLPINQLELHYKRVILPHKIRLDLSYAERATLWTDLSLALRTVRFTVHSHKSGRKRETHRWTVQAIRATAIAVLSICIIFLSGWVRSSSARQLIGEKQYSILKDWINVRRHASAAVPRVPKGNAAQRQ